MIYPVADVFRSIQGEGHFVGYPMTFIRLAGCSVTACHIRQECDEAPWKATFRADALELVSRVRELHPNGIVCITGGEPTDHDLLPLASTLRDAGYRVHLETSGARPVTGFPLEWITVSPKTGQYSQRSGHTLKLVVRPEWGDAVTAWDYVCSYDVNSDFFHRYLQPLTVDGKPVNLDTVIEMVANGYRNNNGRWALSWQAHRAWGLR